MQDVQIRAQTTTLRFMAKFSSIFLFCTVSALIWWFTNDFSVSKPEGFDPLRYEFYARHGLPQAFSDSSSYRMVLLLEFVYQYLPYFIGYVLVMAFIMFGLSYFDYPGIISIGVFSPITFYYIGQTGKDGIAVLAIISSAMIIASKRSSGTILFGFLAIGLALYVRPAVVLIIPIVLVQFRFGTLYALIACTVIAAVFLITSDGYSILSNLEGLAGDEGAGQFAQLIRRFTFGYELQPIMYKIGLLSTSVLFQPALALLKFYYGSPNFVLFEGACFLIFLILILRDRIALKFLVSSLPYAIIIGVSSPFYHFRYLAVAYPVIWAYCRYSTGLGFYRPSSYIINPPQVFIQSQQNQLSQAYR